MATSVRVRRSAVDLERQPPRDHLVENDSQRPEIGAPICLLTDRLFRRHVGGSSENRGRLGEFGAIGKLRQTEVHNFDRALRCDHQVGTLDVAVDDVLLMGRLKTLSGLDGDV